MDKTTKIGLENLLKNSHLQLILNDEISESYEYYKGFYDATRQFMQTFEKLIEAGVFSGTKFNTDN